MTQSLDILPIFQHTSLDRKEKNKYNIKICTDVLREDFNTLIPLNTNARRKAIALVYFSPQPSSLAADLVRYLGPADVTIIVIFQEDQLWIYLNEHSSHKVPCLIIETNSNMKNLISRCHAYKTIRSIFIRCQEYQLTQLQRYTRSLVKVDGIYADNTRILIKLAIDLTLIFEEMGDEERHDRKNELEAQLHYDRALKLCDLVKYL